MLAAGTWVIKEAASLEFKIQVCTTQRASRSDVFVRRKTTSTARPVPFAWVWKVAETKVSREDIGHLQHVAPSGDRGEMLLGSTTRRPPVALFFLRGGTAQVL